MSFHTGNENWISNVYLIDKNDRIEYGAGGIDSLPNIDIANQQTHLKKFKGLIIGGSGEPTSNEGLTEIDANVENNVLYFNTLTGGFWKPTVTGGNISSWTDVTRNVILNVKEFRINGDEDDTTYTKLVFRDEGTLGNTLDFLNQRNKPVDIKARDLKFDEAEGEALRQTYTPDSEFQINADIENESENADSKYGVKRYNASEVLDTAWFKWNETLQRWEIITEQDVLQSLNVSEIFQNGVRAGFLADVLITNQEEFDDVFNTDIDGGVTTFFDPVQENDIEGGSDGAERFYAGSEADLSEWANTATTNGTVTQTTPGLNNTSGKVHCNIPVGGANNRAWANSGTKDITKSSWMLSYYTNFDNLIMANGDTFYTGYIYDYDGTATLSNLIEIYNNAGQKQIRIFVKDDAPVYQVGSRHDLPSGDILIQVIYKKASSPTANDGGWIFYMNGQHIETRLDVDIYNQWKNQKYSILGFVSYVDVGTYGSIYIDECYMVDGDKMLVDKTYKTAIVPSVNWNADDLIGTYLTIGDEKYYVEDNDTNMITYKDNAGTLNDGTYNWLIDVILPNYIYIKPGTYELRNRLDFKRDDLTIETSIGAFIKIHQSISSEGINYMIIEGGTGTLEFEVYGGEGIGIMVIEASVGQFPFRVFDSGIIDKKYISYMVVGGSPYEPEFEVF